nr:primosomal replication protein N [Comamonas sp. Tr-654]
MTGLLAEQAALRYTPAGLPALDLRIEHSSQQQELGSTRNVNASVKAVAFGALAEKLARQAPGSQWTFQGFLATPRNSKMLVLHIQDIQQN